MGQIVVATADCRITQVSGDVLATFALGSCIAVAVHDRKIGVGGLLHFMLPDSTIDPQRARTNPFMFADTGIPVLLEQVFARGATRRNLEVHTAGGAEMMDPDRIFQIGKRNYLAARKILWKAGLLLVGEAVGGSLSRTLRLEVGSGRVSLQESGLSRELRTPEISPDLAHNPGAPGEPAISKGGNQWPTVY